MKRQRKIVALALAAGLLLAGCIRQGPAPEDDRREGNPEDFIGLTAEQRMEDFTYLRDTLTALYPFWGELAEMGIHRDEVLATFEQKVMETTSDIAYMNEVARLFKTLQGSHPLGHLSLMDRDQYDYYVQIYGQMEFGDSWREVMHRDEVERTYSRLKAHSNGEFMVMEDGAGRYAVQLSSRPGLSVEVVNDGKTGYIRIPSFDGARIEEECPRIEAFLAENAGLEDMIIDIRGNGGGNTSYWADHIVIPNLKKGIHATNYFLFREELLQNEQAMKFVDEKHPGFRQEYRGIEELPAMENLTPFAGNFAFMQEEHISFTTERTQNPYQGNIWLLTDSKNYSAADGLIGFCKRTGFATIVGEPSGGNDPYGEPAFFAMPHSGLVWRMDLFYPLNADGSCNAVSGSPPDIECPSADALDVCLQEINKR